MISNHTDCYAGANPNTKNEEGLTPLHTASYNCLPDVAEALIDAGRN